MQIYAWRTEAISGYRSGTVAVAAADAASARAAILADFDRWSRSGFSEHSPLAGWYDGLTEADLVDGYPSIAEEWDREDIDRETTDARAMLEHDLQADPITLPTGILYVWGGD